MEVSFDPDTLQKEFEKTIKEIDEAEENLKVLNPDIKRQRNQDDSHNPYKILPVGFANKQPKLKDSPESPEESPFEEEISSKKVSLKSAVYRRGKDSKIKRDVIRKQNQKVQSRNRRILGMLQSTLLKFQDDAVKRRSQDLKRQRMLEKIEAAEEEEKLKLKQKKKELLIRINEKRLYLDCIKQMMQITKSFSDWKCNKEKLLHFIITEADPQICFLPKSLNFSSERLLEKSRIEILDQIRKKEAAMLEELNEINETYETQCRLQWKDLHQ